MAPPPCLATLIFLSMILTTLHPLPAICEALDLVPNTRKRKNLDPSYSVCLPVMGLFQLVQHSQSSSVVKSKSIPLFIYTVFYSFIHLVRCFLLLMIVSHGTMTRACKLVCDSDFNWEGYIVRTELLDHSDSIL